MTFTTALQPEARSWYAGVYDAQVVVCDCQWKITWFDYDNWNELVLIVAKHFLDDHDYEYDMISRWVSDNWM